MIDLGCEVGSCCLEKPYTMLPQKLSAPIILCGWLMTEKELEL